MKLKFLILFFMCWAKLFAQYPAVPNTNTFNLWNVLDAVYGSHASGNLSDAFTNSVSTKFDAAYGSKTMSPKYLLGFRDYGYVAPPTGYGYLYNYWALANLPATGWRVPDDADWHALALYLDANAIYPTPPATSESTVAGAYLKEAGTSHWTTPNTGATNSSGFTGLPEGARDYRGYFYNRGLTTTWASKTTYGTDAYYYRSLGYDNTNIYRNYARKQYGFSVRLVKNDSTDPLTYTGNDGTVYSTIKIGNQVWLATNLVETKDNTGVYIPVVAGNTEWEALTTGALCTYIP